MRSPSRQSHMSLPSPRPTLMAGRSFPASSGILPSQSRMGLMRKMMAPPSSYSDKKFGDKSQYPSGTYTRAAGDYGASGNNNNSSATDMNMSPPSPPRVAYYQRLPASAVIITSASGSNSHHSAVSHSRHPSSSSISGRDHQHSSMRPQSGYHYDPRAPMPADLHGQGAAGSSGSNLITMGGRPSQHHQPTDHSQPISVKPKRKRASSKQLEALNRVFESTSFPSTETRHRLARELGMTPRTVQIWFQNRRQAMRQQASSAMQSEPTMASMGTTSTGMRSSMGMHHTSSNGSGSSTSPRSITVTTTPQRYRISSASAGGVPVPLSAPSSSSASAYQKYHHQINQHGSGVGSTATDTSLSEYAPPPHWQRHQSPEVVVMHQRNGSGSYYGRYGSPSGTERPSHYEPPTQATSSGGPGGPQSPSSSSSVNKITSGGGSMSLMNLLDAPPTERKLPPLPTPSTSLNGGAAGTGTGVVSTATSPSKSSGSSNPQPAV
ncbi:hypothetical protein H4219_004979 [Mycoemilia scoparia]|uniref:Homeobox domain-containing protein n=1 Tax=Mycoemilia scoparia TaxID=417184 RepID=A0A9W7ZUL5_9FUNG|nr:hypothetical protein H4219_004979 [Mycoemilia scoparia]